MEYLISFAPHAIAFVASVVSVGAGYYFWNKYHKKTEEMKTEQVKLEEIRADIINETKKNHIKILFVGPNGVGKSSLINTFVSAMENKRVKTAVAGSCFVGNTKNFCDYYIEENGDPIITLLDTTGLTETSGNRNDAVLENIKKAFDGNLPYGQNMLEQVPDGSKFMEPMDIVVFVHSATNILKDEWRVRQYDTGYQRQYNALKALHKHVIDMNIANMLVLTHKDCMKQTDTETLKGNAKQKLGFDASDVHLIKCLVDFQVTRDTNIPTAERAQALGVLYAIIHDGVEKKKMMESRHRYRQT